MTEFVRFQVSNESVHRDDQRMFEVALRRALRKAGELEPDCIAVVEPGSRDVVDVTLFYNFDPSQTFEFVLYRLARRVVRNLFGWTPL